MMDWQEPGGGTFGICIALYSHFKVRLLEADFDHIEVFVAPSTKGRFPLDVPEKLLLNSPYKASFDLQQILICK